MGQIRPGDTGAARQNTQTLPCDEIEQEIAAFLKYAKDNPRLTFHLTPIGTGLAGLSKKTIWAMLSRYGVPQNVLLTSTWVTERTKNER